jgi:hypothetical protein
MSAHSPRGSNELRLLACFEADSEVLQGLGRYIDFGKVSNRHLETRHASPAADLTRPKRSGETRVRLPDGLHQELWIERTAAGVLVIMPPEGWELWCQHRVIVNPAGLAGRYKRHLRLISGFYSPERGHEHARRHLGAAFLPPDRADCGTEAKIAATLSRVYSGDRLTIRPPERCTGDDAGVSCQWVLIRPVYRPAQSTGLRLWSELCS